MPAKPDPERDARVTKMHQQGLTDAIMAMRLGITRGATSQIRIRLGLKANRSRL